MKITIAHPDRRIESRSSFMHPFARGFVQGLAGMFDIFGVRARTRKRRSPEDDARNLHGDVQRIGDDFRTVFSKIRATLPK
jgi:hypothetical protein